ncbi:MAG: RNA polymerase sigma-54 factor [Chlamydiales bacterium]|nr:RNA polymerase sigma-54 factor [Chlamydiales bacterium]MCH9634851.1 RNA polymerase sigma-54 factor [Chlamydiales bacterium]MCH9703720.1 RNA polymerase factor sigma-54 [Chlamydiota bacterium]
MRQEFTQQTKQLQRLILSPQMQQALHLLQLPIQELSTLIDEELSLNPLLEYPESAVEVMPEVSKESRSSSMREEEDLRAFIENTVAYEESLSDCLLRQAHETFEKQKELEIAELLIGYLDHNGFLTSSLEEIALLEAVKERELLKVLEEIQSFEPTGVGARSCQEALLIQLRAMGKCDSLAYRIIETNYDDMLHNRIPMIAKKLKAKAEEIQHSIYEEIAHLDLRPGANMPEGHYQERSHHLTPDVVIHYHEGKFTIEINEGKLPSIRFRSNYLSMLHSEALSSEEKAYIEEKISSGKWLLRNLAERNQTLYRIAEEIIYFQKSFLTEPQGKLTPLTMKELASRLELHESTIARAVASKVLQAPRGIFPLRSFFTNSYTNEQGETISANTVRECLQEIISQEDKRKPLSDETISSMIKAKGISCARRTVAKYRGELNIGNTAQRKRHC